MLLLLRSRVPRSMRIGPAAQRVIARRLFSRYPQTQTITPASSVVETDVAPHRGVGNNGGGTRASQLDMSVIDLKQDPNIPVFSRYAANIITRPDRPSFSRYAERQAATSAIRWPGLAMGMPAARAAIPARVYPFRLPTQSGYAGNVAPAATASYSIVGSTTITLSALADMVEGRVISGAATITLSASAGMAYMAGPIVSASDGFDHLLTRSATRSLSRSLTRALAA